MKTTVLILLSSLTVFSCGTYQYLTISHPAIIPADKKFTAVAANIEVSYQFDSLNGVLNLAIKNNTGKPLIMDWKKSAIITNGHAVSLYNSNAAFAATASRDRNIYPVTTNINGAMAMPEGADFISPMSAIYKKTISVAERQLDISFNKKEKVEKTGINHTTREFYGKTFAPAESPYKIRVYLTCRFENETDQVIENEFYISEIITSRDYPETMAEFFRSGQPVIFTYK